MSTATNRETLINLDRQEMEVLRAAIARHVEELIAESAGTGSHDLQHALAQTITCLETIGRKLGPSASSAP